MTGGSGRLLGTEGAVAKLGKASGVSLGHELGEFLVPMNIFLDGEGNPVFAPARWEKFKTGFWHAGHWCSFGPEGRVPQDQAVAQREALEREKRKVKTVRRLADNPEQFRSYKGTMPRTPKEVRTLFKQFPRMINYDGQECRIVRIRETLTMGIVLDLEYDTNRGFVRYKIYHADRKLAEEAIVLDCERDTWVESPRDR